MHKTINSLSSQLKRSLPFVAARGLWLLGTQRDIILAVGFSVWKEAFIQNFFKDQTVLFVDKARNIKLARSLLARKPVNCAIWSFKDEERGLPACVFDGLKTMRIEDGFVRSLGRGIDHQPPWSLCLDEQGMYFDASGPSDFEQLCSLFEVRDFTPELQNDADRTMQLLLKLSISKYNNLSDGTTRSAPQYQKGAVLVLGQVEDDRSITRNQTAISTNRELIARAVADHPDGPIYFKQHPDCLGERRRPGYVDLDGEAQIMEVDRSVAITDAISAVDRVYTISSLGGFEALMRDKHVITFGCPFYAGWGLTDDHVDFPRRTRRLDLLFSSPYCETCDLTNDGS